ncbi:hypothetical protein [Vogesella mureinivorans]|uniref:hypothetical protein n=1 Tax=Vogesella mureinivorans TaxID=657276 RepID=UPI0011C71493|nr:hypothetical protein [Vogesella mureinivorans]
MHSIYTELLHARTETIDRSIKIFLAVMSSGGIAGWVVWKSADWAWASLIAASQFLNAILPFLPYKNRKKSLAALSRELDEISNHMEIKWLEISSGELTEREMRKLFSDMLNKSTTATQKHFPDSSIPDNPKLMNKAEDTTISYLKTYMDAEENNGN